MCYIRPLDLKGVSVGVKYITYPTLLFGILKSSKKTSCCTIEGFPKGYH